MVTGDQREVDDAVVTRTTLAPAGPIERIDRAFVLVRRGGFAAVGRALVAGALPALVLQTVYYAERVEGVGLLRLPGALALVLAFCARSWLLAGVARIYVRSLSEHAPVSPAAGGWISVSRTAVVVGLGLWVWSWGIAISALGGPIGIGFFLPFLALRGLVAPSWLARAACAPESGWRAFWRALSDTRHQRTESFFVEAGLLSGGLGLAVNLYGVFAAAVLVGRSFLGLELALVDEFLSLRNTYVLLAVTLTAAVLLEPLRAALSAQVYVDARVRAEGLDLRAALDEAIARTSPTGRGRGAVAAAALLVLIVGAARARADVPPPVPRHADEAAPDEAARVQGEPLPTQGSAAGMQAHTPPPAATAAADAQARETARAILARDIFRDVDDRRGDGLGALIERLLAWIFEQELPESDASPPPNLPELPLPGPELFLGLGVAISAAVMVFLAVTHRRDAPTAAPSGPHAENVTDPRDRAPDDWLAEASALAAEGRFGEALRALYLATLVALDRRAWIRFEPSLTNWQYLRQMPSGEVREAFRDLTRTFDVKVYGAERASPEDYLRCRDLAEQILHRARPVASAEAAPIREERA
ncbi:MAG: hypothetical protein OHK0013_48420 [Sandaracinaceae bacterium]